MREWLVQSQQINCWLRKSWARISLGQVPGEMDALAYFHCARFSMDVLYDLFHSGCIHLPVEQFVSFFPFEAEANLFWYTFTISPFVWCFLMLVLISLTERMPMTSECHNARRAWSQMRGRCRSNAILDTYCNPYFCLYWTGKFAKLSLPLEN